MYRMTILDGKNLPVDVFPIVPAAIRPLMQLPASQRRFFPSRIVTLQLVSILNSIIFYIVAQLFRMNRSDLNNNSLPKLPIGVRFLFPVNPSHLRIESSLCAPKDGPRRSWHGIIRRRKGPVNNKQERYFRLWTLTYLPTYLLCTN